MTFDQDGLPVPGGVGTVTTSVLVGHVVQAACKKAGVEC